MIISTISYQKAHGRLPSDSQHDTFTFIIKIGDKSETMQVRGTAYFNAKRQVVKRAMKLRADTIILCP